MNIILPKHVSYILDLLNKKGYEAFAVGGCIRDSLLSKSPKDWDITTSAHPYEIIALFNHTVPTGIKHGTVTIIIDGINYEVTTYRIEGNYSDNRHPDNVTFTSKLSEDLSRRDFTINALAYNPREGLVDLYGGRDDLKAKLVRCVGNSDERFKEDALRMIRGIRFSSQLNFRIEPDTLKSICRNHNLIKNVSIERIRDELSRILLSNTPSNGIKILQETNLLHHILPELEACIGFDQRNMHHDKDVYEHILTVLDNTPANLIVRLAALFHDIAKPLCFTLDEAGNGHFYLHNLKGAELSEAIMRRLRFDNDKIKKVSILVREHMNGYEITKKSSIKKLISRVGIDNLDNLFELQFADIKGHKPPHDLNPILNLKKNVSIILEEKLPLSIKDLSISGNDLINIGFSKGKIIGDTLNYLLEIVLDNPDLNYKEKLLELVENRLK